MKKILCACLFVLLNMASSCVHAQQQDKLTITTYYPAPNAVYQTMRLKPGTAPNDAKSGQLFYDYGNDTIKYYNMSNNWTSLMGGAAESDTWDYISYDDFPGAPVKGDIFFNNTTNTLQFRNMTDQWVSLTAGSGFWQETYNTNHYDFITTNHNSTLRRLAIGTGEFAALAVMHRVNSSADEQGKVASFTKYLSNEFTSQELLISLFPRGSVNPYLDSTSLISVPDGHLKLAVINKTRSMDFSVGGWYTHDSDVLFFSNPAGETLPRNYSVTVGNHPSKFPLTVDSPMSNASVFGVRGTYNNTRKTGIFSVMLSGDSAYYTYGCYYENGAFRNDPYILPNGTQNHYYAALEQDHNGTFRWYCGDSATGNGVISGAAGWNKANGITLWNIDGYTSRWPSMPSSRVLKENFCPLDPEDILRKIDQLQVTRWNFKAETPSIKHIGPLSEDFYKIFKIGYADNKFAAIDTAGVSLAGVKALIDKAAAQQKQLDALENRVEALKSKLSQSR
jgi:hypothetical protein